MKIEVSFPGQEVRIVDAMPHIVEQLNKGMTFPYIRKID